MPSTGRGRWCGGDEQGEFPDQVVQGLTGLRADQSEGKVSEEVEAERAGLVGVERGQQRLRAGEITAVAGGDDPGGALHEVGGDRNRTGHAGQSFGAAARAASNRAVTSAQSTRFHSRST